MVRLRGHVLVLEPSTKPNPQSMSAAVTPATATNRRMARLILLRLTVPSEMRIVNNPGSRA